MKNLKMFSLLASFLIVLGLASCSNNDKDPEEILKLSVVLDKSEKQDLILGNTLDIEAKVTNGVEPTYMWTLDGKEVSTELKYSFTPDKVGTYEIVFTAKSLQEEVSSKVSVNVFTSYELVKSIHDIKFWTGEGDQKSVLTIQWSNVTEDHEADLDNIHFLAWGYRWKKEDKTVGEDMVLALAKADPRLFVCLGAPSAYGRPIHGFGYDANGDGVFSISDKDKKVTYTAADFVDGVLYLDGSIDGFTSNDPADYWMGGWYEGYCSYYLGAEGESVPEKYDYSPVGVSGRALVNLSWDAWTFSSINGEMINVQPLPEYLVAAIGN